MEKIKALFKNKKFLRIFIPVLVLAIGGGVFAYTKLSDESIGVQVKEVHLGKVQQFYDTTGTLASGSVEKYYIYEGVVVKEVNVKTGDAVSEGDVLATFDTSSMNKLISEKSKALKNAKENYDNALESQKAAEEAATATPSTTVPATTQAPPETTTSAFTDAEIQAIIGALRENNAGNNAGAVPGGETTTQRQFTDEELSAIAEQLQGAQNQGAQNQNTTMPTFTANNANGIGQNFNLGSFAPMANTSDMVDSYKQAYEAAKADYDRVVADKKALDKGWIATGDGKVGDIYLKAGEAYEYVEEKNDSGNMLSMIMGSSGMDGSGSADISGMLSGVMGNYNQGPKQGIGMIVDYYGGYKITFNLGKYDAQTIKVGMPAFVSYTDYDYEAEVTYIGPYAESGSSAITTMMGSSTTTTSALPAEATITNSDNNLIIGFDAKLSILVAEHDNVLKLPVESLVIEEGEKFVYLYDKTTSTAVKKKVKTGASSETHYEVLDGLKEGDQVITNTSKISDGVEVYLEK